MPRRLNGTPDMPDTSFSTTQDAIGHRDGDYLTLTNKWATVDIERQSVSTYSVRGDVARTDGLSLAEALDMAIASLARYQRGRAD